MPDTNTATAAPATLTEQELFAIFVKLSIQARNVYGPIDLTLLKREYVPEDYLHECGAYGELEDATDLLADYLLDDEHPEDALLTLISSIGAYKSQLRTVLSDFQVFKELYAIEPNLPEEAPSEPEAKKAWEETWEDYDDNPRFALPALKEGEAA